MTPLMNRRAILLGAGAAATTAALPGSAWALNTSQAEALINSLVNEINAVIASGRSENAMIREFESIFKRYSDTSYIAAYAMGVDGRRASASQKKAFSKAFTSYIARKYGKQFRSFAGGSLEVQGVKKLKSFYRVRTMARVPSQAPFEVDFHVSDRSGKDLFFNLYIEGINMLLTEREEIGAMLDKRKGNIDQMISDLRKAG
ncbi:ABC transporter periplasmic binding protein MlaC [Thalassovita mediterranea]|uniref:ABC transporter periplasmic binding protein MlaC n=2 Tax=Thalassovita mediterranea TaxID=340021 RepID=A0A0P1H3X6_9RHOB|nr:ABC transporter periplasmic binding protein MlaC [Thalassovita mediterranea]SIS30773.1 phospholipid transport system substrate-binding protein [Thalassovita mediterranea]